jgi:GT2 family glycosyltransferase
MRAIDQAGNAGDAITPTEPLPFPIRILAIIVTYKMEPLKTPSFLTLQKAQRELPDGHLQLRTLIYDNSCDGRNPGRLPDDVEYEAALVNTGLSLAYNKALSRAIASGYDWLLTLDQDTSLPSDFLLRITETAAIVAHDNSIAAIVPSIKDAGISISPIWFLAGVLPRYYHGTVGLGARTTSAFNSAALLRVAAVREVGGYNPWFWLDCSDGYIFRQFERHGKRVFVCGDIEVPHNFALNDMDSQVSLNRYHNMLLAESAFWDREMNALAGFERTLQLLRMTLRHVFLRKAPQHRAITREFLKRRLFWSKKRRLREWERETLERFPMLSNTRHPPFV